MSFNELKLPLQIERYGDESGVGYCLRAIVGNGANLHALRRLVGMRAVERFGSHHAKVLGRVFQQSADWFENTLPSVERTKPFQIDFYGHRWFSRNCLRISNPQVCVRCIHSKGYCRAIWDVSVATVCLEHQCRLSDCCGQCGQALRWDRPRIDYGHCGHLLTTALSVEVHPSLFELQEMLEWKFSTPSKRININGHLSFLSDLSLSAIHTLILSFGLRKKPLEVLHSTVRTKAYRCAEWTAVIERALERLLLLHSGNSEPSQLSDWVSDNLLEHVALNHYSTHDQHYAVELLEKLFDIQLASGFGSRLGQLSQLKLF